MSYTVGQIQSLISSVVNQQAQQQHLSNAQANNLMVAAEGTAQVESSFNPTDVAPSGNGGSVWGLYQLEVPNGMGAAYANNPNALLNPNTNANIAIGAMAQVAAQNPNFSPGQIAVTSQRPFDSNTQASQYNNYINNVNRDGSQIISGNSTVPTTQVLNNQPLPKGINPKMIAGTAQQSTFKGVQWYNPTTWTLPVYNTLGQGVAVLIGAVLIFEGFKMTFGMGKGVGSTNIEINGLLGNKGGGGESKTEAVAEES